MSDLESEIRDIKARITQAQASATRQEIRREAAQKALDEARTALREEFGVSDPAQARAVLAGLEDDLQTALKAAREALDR